jgi:hypothetical protein
MRAITALARNISQPREKWRPSCAMFPQVAVGGSGPNPSTARNAQNDRRELEEDRRAT